MPDKKGILIISYVFPPFPGIGSRRWAKFAKYLSRSGYQIHVISCENYFTNESQWTKDTLNENINVYNLSPGISRHLNNTPKSLKEKLLYRSSLFISRMLSKGNPYDRALFWNKKLPELTRQIIQTHPEIKNIIVSGAPFNNLVYIGKLKEEYPNINFIADFRDPWTSNKTAFGFDSLGKQRQQYEIQNEQLVLNTYDYIITVADELTNELKQKPRNSSNQFLTIPNGFDKEDFSVTQSTVKKDKLKFIFTGTFYNKATHHFESLIDALNNIQNTNPKIYQNIEFHFYGTQPPSIKELAKRSSITNIHFHQPLSLNKMYEAIQAAGICMLFLSDDINYSFSTKFCEYISQKKKIALFSIDGPTANFIASNNIGYHIKPSTVTENIFRIYKDYKNNQLLFNPIFNINTFDVANISKQLLQILK